MTDGEPPLAGRVALVTGGGKGIGAAISTRLAELGAAVAVHQRTAEEARGVADAIRITGRQAAPVGGDLSGAEGCGHAVARARAALGQIDILVNNAAITGPRAVTPLLDLDDQVLEQLVAVNLLAAIRLSKLVAARMGSGGVIVNVGSTAAFVAQPDSPVYAATKSALVGLTRSLALDLAPRGIRAVHVAPGAIAAGASLTPAYADERAARAFSRTAPAGRWGTPWEVATVVGFLCTDEASYVTGSSVIVDGGLLTF